MSNSKFALLILVIVGVGVMIAFGPRFLDQKQGERDNSTDCMLYRTYMQAALQYQQLGDDPARDAQLTKAIERQKAGNCSDFF